MVLQTLRPHNFFVCPVAREISGIFVLSSTRGIDWYRFHPVLRWHQELRNSPESISVLHTYLPNRINATYFICARVDNINNKLEYSAVLLTSMCSMQSSSNYSTVGISTQH